jgi:hypothetical protein
MTCKIINGVTYDTNTAIRLGKEGNDAVVYTTRIGGDHFLHFVTRDEIKPLSAREFSELSGRLTRKMLSYGSEEA